MNTNGANPISNVDSYVRTSAREIRGYSFPIRAHQRHQR
jgi:hypothetical protein